MKILALDTATEACSAALRIGSETIERFEVLGRGHAERLLPMVQEVLAEGGVALSALDAIAFGRGPGSFTGLRIGAGVTQGLAYGAGLRVVPVSDLAALAAQAAVSSGQPNILACLDARMAQVYWGSLRLPRPGRAAGTDAGGRGRPGGRLASRNRDIPIFLSGETRRKHCSGKRKRNPFLWGGARVLGLSGVAHDAW